MPKGKLFRTLLLICPLLLPVQAAAESDNMASGIYQISRPQQQLQKLDGLLASLSNPDLTTRQIAEISHDLANIFGDSGSPSMNLLLRWGEAASDAKQYAVAATHLDALVRLSPAFAGAWFARARLNNSIGDKAQALDDLTRSISLEPRDFRAQLYLGDLLTRSGDYRRALSAYEQTLEINPHLVSELEDKMQSLRWLIQRKNM